MSKISLSGLVIISIGGITRLFVFELLNSVFKDSDAILSSTVAAAALMGCKGAKVFTQSSLHPVWCSSIKLVSLSILHLQISILFITA